MTFDVEIAARLAQLEAQLVFQFQKIREDQIIMGESKFLTQKRKNVEKINKILEIKEENEKSQKTN